MLFSPSAPTRNGECGPGLLVWRRCLRRAHGGRAPSPRLGVGVLGLQLWFDVIRVRQGLLILQVGSGEHDECRESTVVSRAWACGHREGEKGSEGCPGLIL
jgi:hypothetical protein